MKRFILAVLVASAAFNAQAGDRWGTWQYGGGYRGGHVHSYPHYHGGGGNNWNWVAPAVVGGVIGYGIARSTAPVYVPPAVITTPPAPYDVCAYPLQAFYTPVWIVLPTGQQVQQYQFAGCR